MRNCLNCGAPIEADVSKCKYCGTSYFDFTNIDFQSNKPVYVRMRVPSGDKDVVVTQMAIPRLQEINAGYNTVDVCNWRGDVVNSYVSKRTLETSVVFEAVPMVGFKDSDVLYTVEVND